MSEPRELVAEVEQSLKLPQGNEERFAGYGVMGLPFASGHVLGLRRWPASSLGKGYTSVWHRNSEGAMDLHSECAAPTGLLTLFR